MNLPSRDKNTEKVTEKRENEKIFLFRNGWIQGPNHTDAGLLWALNKSKLTN